MTTSDPSVAGLAHFGTVVVVCFFTVVDGGITRERLVLDVDVDTSVVVVLSVDGGITRERLVLDVDVDTSVVVVLSVDAEPHADMATRDPRNRSRKRTL